MKIRALLLLLLTIASPCFALDADEIKAIAKQPHSREKLVPELKIYPDAREYSMRVRAGKPGEDLQRVPEVTATEKTVEGKYIVSEFTIPGSPGALIMVVTYDKAAAVYRKWVLLPDGEIGESVGVAISMTRSISWGSTHEAADGTRVVSLEVHDDNGTSWREVAMDGSKAVGVNEGRAKKTK